MSVFTVHLLPVNSWKHSWKSNWKHLELAHCWQEVLLALKWIRSDPNFLNKPTEKSRIMTPIGWTTIIKRTQMMHATVLYKTAYPGIDPICAYYSHYNIPDDTRKSLYFMKSLWLLENLIFHKMVFGLKSLRSSMVTLSPQLPWGTPRVWLPFCTNRLRWPPLTPLPIQLLPFWIGKTENSTAQLTLFMELKIIIVICLKPHCRTMRLKLS